MPAVLAILMLAILLVGWGLLLYFFGYQFGVWRTRHVADSYVNRARLRLVVAEQLCERAELLLAKATHMSKS